MTYYYVNKKAQSNWDHEVHTLSCSYLPDQDNRISLWSHTNCKDAIKEAKKHYNDVDGCYRCCRECHTS